MLAVICWATLIKMSGIAAEFEELQGRQELLVETQKLVMRCDETYGVNEEDESTHSDDVDDDDAKGHKEEDGDDDQDRDEGDHEEEPLLLRGGGGGRKRLDRGLCALEMRWYSRNVGFVEDILNVIQRKSLSPRLFRAKLNAVLIPTIFMMTVAGILILLKLFAEMLLYAASP